MPLYDDALGVLRGWTAPDAGQDTLRRGYLRRLSETVDALFKPSTPSHLTAGAIVLSPDGEQVLLNLHRKAGRWFHFGGHLEHADTSLAGAALRETTEESGLTGVRLDPVPVHLSRHTVAFCHPGEAIDHLDVRFVALPADDAPPVASEESHDVRWFGVDDLPTDEPDMLELIALARARARTSQNS